MDNKKEALKKYIMNNIYKYGDIIGLFNEIDEYKGKISISNKKEMISIIIQSNLKPQIPKAFDSIIDDIPY